ncbi:cytoplasmic dynein 1 light intermediate chain 1 isoform X2 [Oncorhynchus nerka]|uniref:cytoplasmic dynein 1 light intermediate chain 1 isoform X2 n=1 Tax=Oncorhynchus nerka TaxID=8023 RepID=UPI0011302684|nr:cytoplasmic dynein 1 light intermediate chain 1-like isoform X2 [Oncorhynchus nerka]
MAASGRSTLLSSNNSGLNSTAEQPNTEDEDGQDLWSAILSEVSTHSRSKLPSGKNVLVMGEVGSGKTTLVAKLQGVEDFLKGRGLEYLYFSVHDDDIDDQTRCNAWVLDGDLYHKGLQSVAVQREALGDSLLLITVDLSRPWVAMESLQKWAAVAREHIDKLRVPPETLRELENRMARQFQEYVDPGWEESAPQRRSEEEENVLLPLGENTLTHNLGLPMVVVCTKVRTHNLGLPMVVVCTKVRTHNLGLPMVVVCTKVRTHNLGLPMVVVCTKVRTHNLGLPMVVVCTKVRTHNLGLPMVVVCTKVRTHNLGLPMVVVCTKCDAISTLEKEYDYKDEHLDFIQSYIRRFCLQYGASLLYTSVKEMKNVDVLYKYLVHRLYGFPFHYPAQLVEKDTVFIPSGWDNENKISILHENFQTLKLDDIFEEVIVKPPVRKFVHEKEIQAEDDQVFLLKLQSLLSKQPPASAGRPGESSSSRGPSGSPRTSNRSAAANVANTMPQSGQTSEGVLANFFNSLLTKKAGASPPGNSTPGTVRKSGSKLGLSDVQAELDRISCRENDETNNSNTNNPNPSTETNEEQT